MNGLKRDARGRFVGRKKCAAAVRIGRMSWKARVKRFGLERLRAMAEENIGPHKFRKGENKMSDVLAAISRQLIENAIQVYAAFHSAGSDPTPRIEELGLSNDAINRALAILDDEGLLVLTVGGNDIQSVSYDLRPEITRDEGMARLDALRGRKQAGDAVAAG